MVDLKAEMMDVRSVDSMVDLMVDLKAEMMDVRSVD